MEDLIIVGAGPVGLYASNIAALHLLKGVCIEAGEEVGGQLSALYPEKDIVDLPGYPVIKAKEFIDQLVKQHDHNPNALPIKLNETILSIEKVDDHYVVKSNKETYETKCILLTTGMGTFTPRKTGLPNEDHENVIYAMKSKETYRDKNMVILGGGDSAVDWANNLTGVAKSVAIVHRRDDFRAQSSSVELMEKNGVNICKNVNVISLNGEGELLESITIKHNVTGEETTLPLDNLFVNYGQVPAKDTFPVEKKGPNIVVKECYETSLENVFACGNIINYPGKVKNITSGLGEAVIIITKIDQIINPTKNIPVHF